MPEVIKEARESGLLSFLLPSSPHCDMLGNMSYRRNPSSLLTFVIVVACFTALCAFNVLMVSLASDSRARQAAENIGLTRVQVESKSFAFGALSGCSQHDNVQFTVTGYDARNKIHTLHICATVPLGGYTVRS